MLHRYCAYKDLSQRQSPIAGRYVRSHEDLESETTEFAAKPFP